MSRCAVSHGVVLNTCLPTHTHTHTPFYTHPSQELDQMVHALQEKQKAKKAMLESKAEKDAAKKAAHTPKKQKKAA